MRRTKKAAQWLQAALLLLPFGCAKNIPANKPPLNNELFDQRLTSLLRFNVDLMGVDQLQQQQDSLFILDTRTAEEFAVSHIPGARHLGYRNLNKSVLNDIPKDAPIVLYCSVGYRSERVGNRLKRLGYQNVHNLYGSIFEWVNHGYTVVTPEGEKTQKIHTYNRNWSRWVNQSSVKKVW